MERTDGIALLVEHTKNPRYKNIQRLIDEADVALAGGSPECGGSVVIYLRGDSLGNLKGLSWSGEGDTISMGATSIAIERILDRALGMEEVLRIDYDEFVEGLGREIIGSRTRNAALG